MYHKNRTTPKSWEQEEDNTVCFSAISSLFPRLYLSRLFFGGDGCKVSAGSAIEMSAFT